MVPVGEVQVIEAGDGQGVHEGERTVHLRVADVGRRRREFGGVAEGGGSC
ncbi:hypothetical protein [Streptomyces sp. DH12]|nr:hypothetical protein [Streptomyces sp. DH12]